MGRVFAWITACSVMTGLCGAIVVDSAAAGQAPPALPHRSTSPKQPAGNSAQPHRASAPAPKKGGSLYSFMDTSGYPQEWRPAPHGSGAASATKPSKSGVDTTRSTALKAPRPRADMPLAPARAAAPRPRLFAEEPGGGVRRPGAPLSPARRTGRSAVDAATGETSVALRTFRPRTAGPKRAAPDREAGTAAGVAGTAGLRSSRRPIGLRGRAGTIEPRVTASAPRFSRSPYAFMDSVGMPQAYSRPGASRSVSRSGRAADAPRMVARKGAASPRRAAKPRKALPKGYVEVD